MAVTSGFFNSLNHDRVYNNIQMGQIFDGIINDGVLPNFEDHLVVKSGSGMRVIVGSGRAWFNHTWTYNSTDLPLTIGSASATQDRIDAVVLRVDNSLGVRANSILIKNGTPSGSPQRPTMTKTSDISEYPLAYVKVAHGVTNITSADITNAIGTSACPLATLVENTFNADTIIRQWQAQFDDTMASNKREWRELIESVVTDPSAITSIPNSVIDNMFVIH
jgi:hypothetical protein